MFGKRPTHSTGGSIGTSLVHPPPHSAALDATHCSQTLILAFDRTNDRHGLAPPAVEVPVHPATTVLELKQMVSHYCAAVPGFAGPSHIGLYNGGDTRSGKRLFNAMTCKEAGLTDASRLWWSCLTKPTAERARADRLHFQQQRTSLYRDLAADACAEAVSGQREDWIQGVSGEDFDQCGAIDHDVWHSRYTVEADPAPHITISSASVAEQIKPLLLNKGLEARVHDGSVQIAVLSVSEGKSLLDAIYQFLISATNAETWLPVFNKMMVRDGCGIEYPALMADAALVPLGPNDLQQLLAPSHPATALKGRIETAMQQLAGTGGFFIRTSYNSPKDILEAGEPQSDDDAEDDDGGAPAEHHWRNRRGHCQEVDEVTNIGRLLRGGNQNDAKVKRLRVRTADEALKLLRESNRALIGLSRGRQHLGPTLSLSIVVASWEAWLPTRSEFRCFVHGRKLTAISQYFFETVTSGRLAPTYMFTSDEARMRLAGAVSDAVERLFTQIRDALPWDNVVMDVTVRPASIASRTAATATADKADAFAPVDSEGRPSKRLRADQGPTSSSLRAQIIEFNPWGAELSTGSALFHWTKDQDLLESGADDGRPEVRLC